MGLKTMKVDDAHHLYTLYDSNWHRVFKSDNGLDGKNSVRVYHVNGKIN